MHPPSPCGLRRAGRRSDWPKRLIAAVEAARGRRFAWGQHDCALFAATCVEAMTGLDLAAGLRGAYGNARAAVAALDAMFGVKTLAELGDLLFGPPIDPALAQRGDVALVDVSEIGEAAGVVLGRFVAAPGPLGVVNVPRDRATRAWRVAR